MQAQRSVPIPAELEPEYHQCHEILWSAPLSEFSEYVDKGFGSHIQTGTLGDALTNIRCSDAQIITYMEYHGLPYQGTVEMEKTFQTGKGPLNRAVNFCIKSQGLLNWLVSGRCGGGVQVMMVDDKISHIIGFGGK